MPGKKELYKRRKKSNSRKKYKKFNQLKASSGFPPSLYTKVVFSESYQMNSTTGSIVNQTFSGNSAFDPDYTGVGHQPYFYDQLTAVYNSYIVYASKIEIVAGTNSVTDTRLILRPAIPNTGIADMDLECERPGAKCVYVNAGSAPTKVSMLRKTSQVFGTQSKNLDENFQAASNANPNNRWYWLVGTRPTDESSTAAVQMTVKITYYCRFFDRATVGSS